MKKYVIGFGDNVVDYYMDSNIKYPGGNAVNFSVNAVKNGIPAYYIGSIANDPDGDLIYNSLRDSKVNVDFVERYNTKYHTENTKVKLESGDRKIISMEKGKRKTPDLTESIISVMKKSCLVHSSCHSNVERKLPILKQNGIKVSYDFDSGDKYHTDKYLKYVCPNIYIAQFSMFDRTKDEINRLFSICSSCNVPYALCTRGSKPALFANLRTMKIVSGFNHIVNKPLDTMGAGDSYFAAFASTFVTKINDVPIENLIKISFRIAADSSKRTIMEAGAYGHGKAISKKLNFKSIINRPNVSLQRRKDL